MSIATSGFIANQRRSFCGRVCWSVQLGHCCATSAAAHIGVSSPQAQQGCDANACWCCSDTIVIVLATHARVHPKFVLGAC
jgi:hypothetical protein